MTCRFLLGGLPALTQAAEKQWEQLWASDAYEDDYYFVSQLFERNWQPRTMA